MQYSKFSFLDGYDLHEQTKAVVGEFAGFSESVGLLAQKVLAESDQLRTILQGTTTEYEDDLESIRKS